MKLRWLSGLAAAATLGGLLWWRRNSLPCPTWLAWMLQGDLMERLLGTETTLNRIGLRPGQRVLEVGPGPGRLLIPAARRVLPGGDVTGLDIQAGMLDRLQARAVKAGIRNLRTALGDAMQPHFPPDSFDVVYLCTVLGEIPDGEVALRHFFTALKPGGRLSITEIFPDPHYQSPETVRCLAETAGFKPHEQLGRWYFYTANFVKP